ncbi:MAG TPA: molybdopterin-dependent oxidoreductase [Mycobacteriales bacterium]|nr:molybdopterin-dependent oxidoreductase [Mycobacteriales bacterium]
MTDGTPVGRRVVLGMLGAGALGVLAGGPLSSVATRAVSALSSHDPTGVSSLLPTGGWRIYTVTDEPTRTPADYRLAVGGLVEKPTTLTFADLQAMPVTRLTRDFQCVTGWRVPKVHWAGVRLADLLDAVGVQPSAKALRFTSFDGVYTESLTLDQSRRPDVLVAYGMDGGPVSHDHGGPVRMLVAPMYGYKSCKWLGGIQLTPTVIPGYWEQYGYAVDGWVGRSNFRDDPPT